jgi:hypothetical protein
MDGRAGLAAVAGVRHLRREMPAGPVALVTCTALPALTDDDRLLQAALAARGAEAVPAVWDDPSVRWRDFGAVVVRSTWDYHLRPGEFRAWVDRVDALGVALHNPAPVLRWNASKHYLRALADAGAAVTPTRWVGAGDPTPLAEVLDAEGWDDAVVKPVVSATAHETWRVGRGTAADAEPRWRALVARADVMVQPFVRAVVDEGEWSLVFLGGTYSHAALKRPRAGDFRVQHEHGGTYAAAEPAAALVAEAARALAVAPAPCAYARVDGCAVGGRFQLMELELLEPALFLGAAPGAADRLAAAILG